MKRTDAPLKMANYNSPRLFSLLYFWVLFSFRISRRSQLQRGDNFSMSLKDAVTAVEEGNTKAEFLIFFL